MPLNREQMKLYQRARRKKIKDLYRDEITLRIDGIEERVYLLERKVGEGEDCEAGLRELREEK